MLIFVHSEFVAVPLGQALTVEGQLSGKEVMSALHNYISRWAEHHLRRMLEAFRSTCSRSATKLLCLSLRVVISPNINLLASRACVSGMSLPSVTL